MPFYRIPGFDGMVHINFGRRKGPAPCLADLRLDKCCAMSGYLCDWPIGDEGETCEMPLCDAHATQVEKNRHYCPAHAAQWRDECPQLPLQLMTEVDG
jgi:hypothetical protein